MRMTGPSGMLRIAQQALHQILGQVVLPPVDI